MAQHHEAVKFVFALRERLQKSQDCLRRDPLRFRRASRKPRVVRKQACMTGWKGGNKADSDRSKTELFQKGSAVRYHGGPRLAEPVEESMRLFFEVFTVTQTVVPANVCGAGANID